MVERADILKISKSIVIGENEKCVFHFMKKKPRWTFWPTQYITINIWKSHFASYLWKISHLISRSLSLLICKENRLDQVSVAIYLPWQSLKCHFVEARGFQHHYQERQKTGFVKGRSKEVEDCLEECLE